MYKKYRKIANNKKYITKDKYSSIAIDSDIFLSFYKKYNQIVAIRDLHIVRTSGFDFKSLSYNIDIFYDIYCILKNFIFLLIAFLKSITSRNNNPIIFRGQVDFLFISHYTNQIETSGKYIDSYFGSIVENLEKKGKTCIVVYINHIRDNRTNLIDGKGLKLNLLRNDANFFQLISIYKGIVDAFFYLNKTKKLFASKEMVHNARIALFSSSTVRNLIIADQVNNIVKKTSPKFVVTTYEGHAWERLVYYNSKMHKKTKCVAYQHAPIFKYQHAIKRGLGIEYDPDLILTTGITPKLQLQESNELKSSKICVIGSGRFLKEKENCKINGNTCIVIPEGNLYECSILFKFALKCAKQLNTVNFIFRFPPMLNIDSMYKYNNESVCMPNNMTISDVGLLDDISRSNFILYRGSSVVIQAVVFGVNPIYLKINGELNIDPLYKINKGRKVVSNIEEFDNSLIDNMDADTKKYLIDYCKSIYSPLNVDILERCLLLC